MLFAIAKFSRPVMVHAVMHAQSVTPISHLNNQVHSVQFVVIVVHRF